MEDEDEETAPWTTEEKVEYLLSEKRVDQRRLDDRFAKLQKSVEEVQRHNSFLSRCLFFAFVLLFALILVVARLLGQLERAGVVPNFTFF